MKQSFTLGISKKNGVDSWRAAACFAQLMQLPASI
jgi:hypothetical protein